MPNLTQNNDVALARIEEQLVALNDKLAQHTDQDMSQFDALFTKLDELDTKMNSMLLREAHSEGERAATRRVAGYIAFVVSTVVAIIGNVIMRVARL